MRKAKEMLQKQREAEQKELKELFRILEKLESVYGIYGKKESETHYDRSTDTKEESSPYQNSDNERYP